MYKPCSLLTLVFILFAVATHAAPRTAEGHEPEVKGGGHSVAQIHSGAPPQSTPLVYAIGLLGDVVWFHLSETLL